MAGSSGHPGARVVNPAAVNADSGVFVHLVEYPAVPVDHARLSMQVMATHEPAQIDQAVQRIVEARRLAEDDLKAWRSSAP